MVPSSSRKEHANLVRLENSTGVFIASKLLVTMSIVISFYYWLLVEIESSIEFFESIRPVYWLRQNFQS